MQQPSHRRRRRPARWSIRRDPLPINPAVLAATGGETVAVHMIGYVARRLDYDAEECIQKALEDGEIEMYYPDRGGVREHDVCRLTAKGRRTSDNHLREAYEMSRDAVRRERAWAESVAGTAGKEKPPPPEEGIAFRLLQAWLILVFIAVSWHALPLARAACAAGWRASIRTSHARPCQAERTRFRSRSPQIARVPRAFCRAADAAPAGALLRRAPLAPAATL